jgi:hypothetical protein
MAKRFRRRFQALDSDDVVVGIANSEPPAAVIEETRYA